MDRDVGLESGQTLGPSKPKKEQTARIVFYTVHVSVNKGEEVCSWVQQVKQPCWDPSPFFLRHAAARRGPIKQLLPMKEDAKHTLSEDTAPSRTDVGSRNSVVEDRCVRTSKLTDGPPEIPSHT